MDRYKFGEFIYQKRKVVGLTQEELGKKLGVTNKAVSKWEVGETLPDVTMLKPLATVLGISVDELLSQKEIQVEEKKTIKTNKLLWYLVIGLAILEVLTIGIFLISNSIKISQNQVMMVDVNNYQEVLNITPMSDFLVEDQKITINSLYELNEGYYLKEDFLLTISYQINYYYYCNDGTLGVITYYNRIVDIKLTKDDLASNSSFVLEPKTEIIDFKGLKNVEINYEVTSCDGVVYKNPKN